MFIFNNIFTDSPIVLKLILTSLLFIFIFYTLGRIIQTRFNLKKDFSLLAFPIGFFSYVIITQIFYFIFLLDILNIENNILVLMEIMKNSFILIIIFILYKSWIPKISFSKWEKIYIATDLSIILISVIIFFIADHYLFNSINSEGGTYYEAIFNIEKDNVFDISLDRESGFLTASVQYESFYYWFSSIGTLLSQDSNTEMIPYISKYLGPLFIIISISSISVHTFSKNRNIFTRIISLLASIIFLFSLALIGTLSNEFYSCGLMIIIGLLLLSYSYDTNPDNSYIFIVLIMSIASTSFTLWSIYIIFFVGVLSILLTIIRSGEIIRNIIYFVLIFMSIESIYWIITFLEYPDLINTVIFVIISIAIISLCLLVPLYSIAFSPGRRKDLNSFEIKITKKIHYIVWSSLILFIILVFIISLSTGGWTLIANLQIFFNSIITDKPWISFMVYMVVIILPIICIYIARYLGYKNTLLALFIFINIIFNPMVLSEVLIFFTVDINWIIIFVPSIFIIISWTFSLAFKLLPKNLRL